jgi:hypothetical protein
MLDTEQQRLIVAAKRKNGLNPAFGQRTAVQPTGGDLPGL